MKKLLPYFLLLRPYWFPFSVALVCGVVYGASSGFGLPYMIDQVFPKIFPGENTKLGLSKWELLIYVSWFPIVFLFVGVSGYFNTYFINYCGIRVLEKIRLKFLLNFNAYLLPFFNEIRKVIY